MNEEPPLSLDALQGWMQNALVFPGSTRLDEIEQVVAPSSRLSAAERLAIYQRSYYARLLSCMKGQYEALRYTLGEDVFTDFAVAYLRAYPSESHTLSALGARFPAFLEETRPDRDEPPETREPWVDFMVDLAQFERRLYVLFDAPGHEGNPFADATVPDERLRLQPCFALEAYRFPVSWYYRQVRDEQNPDYPDPAPCFVALVRRQYLTRVFTLARPQYAFLQALVNGKSVGEALAAVAQAFDRPVEPFEETWSRPDGWRAHWIDAGFFVEADCCTT